jgi:hypothetical protein
MALDEGGATALEGEPAGGGVQVLSRLSLCSNSGWALVEVILIRYLHFAPSMLKRASCLNVRSLAHLRLCFSCCATFILTSFTALCLDVDGVSHAYINRKNTLRGVTAI